MRHAHPQVGGQIALDRDGDDGLGGFGAGVEVDNARNALHLGHRLRSQRLKLLLIRPLNADLDLLAAESALHADVDRRDPRDGRQSGTHRGDQVLHGALALRAVFQLHKDRGVILTLQGAGIDRGVGEHRFREFAQRGFYLPRLFHCEIERRTHRGVELHKELVVVGLRYKLRPNLSA